MEEQASFEPRAVLAPRRAGSNRVAVIVPALALAATAWAGLSGPRAASDVANLQREPSVAAPPTATAPAPTVAPAPGGARYPTAVLGLDVRTLLDLDPVARADAVVAVAGWYMPSSKSNCPPTTDVAPRAYVAELGVVADRETFCARFGQLFPAAPLAYGGPSDQTIWQAVRRTNGLTTIAVAMTPGVVVPEAISVGGAFVAAPVVLVGRIVDPGSMCAAHVGCPPELAVDRVVWAAGFGLAQTTSILPSLLDRGPLLSWRPRDRLAEATVGPTGAILMETLVDQPTLFAVDPAAAAQISRTAPKAERIWYRRALGPDPARDEPRWVAIDDMTGKALGGGAFEPMPVVIAFSG